MIKLASVRIMNNDFLSAFFVMPISITNERL